MFLLRFPFAALCLFCLLLGGCNSGSTDPDPVAGAPQGAGPPPQADINVQLFPGQAVDARGVLASHGGGDGQPVIHSVEVTVTKMDGTDLGTVEQDVDNPDESPIVVPFQGVPVGEDFLVTAVALDENGNVLFDGEELELLTPDSDRNLDIGLLPPDEVRSAVVLIQPSLLLDAAGLAALTPEVLAELEQQGFRLVDGVLVWPLSPAAGYLVQVGQQSETVRRDGRFRIAPPPAGVTEGTITHPTDPALTTTFDVAELSMGQRARAILVFQVPFEGLCGMTPGIVDEFCGDVQPRQGIVDVLLQAFQPMSTNILNFCNMIVPLPTESTTTARGTYPDPKQFAGNGTAIFTACHNECEQDNGLIQNGGTTAYLGSTCHRFVAFGCCPNENFISDSEQLLRYPASFFVKNAANLLDLITGGRTGRVVILSPPTIPRDAVSCMDNHKGRECQQVFIGDVSLDFRASGRGQVILPNVKGTTIKVLAGESIDFVLHNNGCFGFTDVTATRKEINGTLSRTYLETMLGQGPNRSNSGANLMISTNDLLGGSPTFGEFTGFNVPQGQNVTPADTGYFGYLADSKTIEHFFNDPARPVGQGICAKYRYFCDVALRYQVPETAQLGQRDTFVFTVDTCPVDVTFVVVSQDEIDTGLQPLAPIIQADVSEFNFEHCVGVSPCPQMVRTVRVTNTGMVPVNVEPAITASSGLSATLQGGGTTTRLDPGQSANFDVFFDCSQTESYTTSIAFKGTSVVDGREFIDNVPVVAIIKHMAVLLDFDFGPFPAGTEIRLSRIEGEVIAQPDVCSEMHVHGDPIVIDGVHIGFDPNPGACGFGVVVKTEGGK